MLMKQIMIAIVILLAWTIKSYAGNSVWVKQQNQDKDTTIFIKQDGSDNKVGISADVPFVIDGENLTLIIRQVGNSNITNLTSHLLFAGEDMTLDLDIKGGRNILKLEGDTDSTGHYYDLDVRGTNNSIRIDNRDADDTANTNIDLDLVGTSNDFWIKSRGDGHFFYVLLSGDDNILHVYTHTDSVGMNTNSNVSIGPNVASHGQLADSTGSEGATLDAYVIGNDNTLYTSSYGTGNYQVHDIIGNSNQLLKHASHNGDFNTIIIKGNNNYLKTIVSGNSNVLKLHQEGGTNTARVYIYTSNSAINMAQVGGANTADINVSGDSIYDYTLNFTQDGSDTCNYSFNRNTQTADVTATVSNGC